MTEWSVVSVSDLKASQDYALATGPFGSSIGSRFFQTAGVPVIRGSNLSADVGVRLDEDDMVFVSHEKAKEFYRSTVHAGDLVFTCWGTVNQVGLIDIGATFPEYVISNKQMKLTPDPEKADSLFLYYLFSGPEFQNRIGQEAIGSSVPGFNLGQLRRMPVRLPSLREQRAIAHILGTLDDKIGLNHRINETLEAMARALFKSWFVVFEPVRAKAEGRDTGLPQCVAELFPDRFVDSELGEIPGEWSIKSLDEVARFLNGLAMQKYPPTSGRSLPVIKIAQLRAGNTDGADQASAELDPDYIIEDGDILFSWSGSLECMLWAGGQGALNQHLFKVTSTDYPRWLCYLGIDHHLGDFRQIAAGKATTMGHIQRHHLSDARLPIPPSGLLRAMDAIMGPLIESTWRRDVESRTLASLRDALLPKLISGELRVKEPDRFIEEAVA